MYFSFSCPQRGSKIPISASYLVKCRRSFEKTCEISKVEKVKRLCNSLLLGTGLRPVAVCKDPPTTLFLAFANCLFDRAECAVMRLTCVSETDTEYRFSPTLVNSAFLDEIEPRTRFKA